jgi:hypothetical protein
MDFARCLVIIAKGAPTSMNTKQAKDRDSRLLISIIKGRGSIPDLENSFILENSSSIVISLGFFSSD